MTKIITNFFSGVFLFILITTNAIALEISDYQITSYGWTHSITIALDSLDDRAKVRCVIEKDGKPVGMKTQWINGVGTITIRFYPVEFTGTYVNCSVID